MTMSIEEIKKGLRAGDRVWIAEQLPGSFRANKVCVTNVLEGIRPGIKGKSAKVIELAIKRVKFNEAINNASITIAQNY